MPDRVEHQVDVQNRLVSNLLDSSSIEMGQLDLPQERCDLVTLVREVGSPAGPNPCLLIWLDVSDQETVPMLVNAHLIGQALSNYLTNSYSCTIGWSCPIYL